MLNSLQTSPIIEANGLLRWVQLAKITVWKGAAVRPFMRTEEKTAFFICLTYGLLTFGRNL